MSIFDYLRPSYWAGSTAETCVEADTLCRATDAIGVTPRHLPQVLQNILSGISEMTGGYISPMTATVATAAVVSTGVTVLAMRQLRTDVAKLVTKDLLEAIKNDAELMKKFKALEANKAVIAQIKGMKSDEGREFASKMKDQGFAGRFLGFNEQQQVQAVKGFQEVRAQRIAKEQEAKKVEAQQAKTTTAKPASSLLDWVRPSAYKWENSYLNPRAYGKKGTAATKTPVSTTTPVDSKASTIADKRKALGLNG
jgi:hypothetical protein